MALATESGKMIEFMTLVGKLKEVKRTGWVLRGIQDPECVAGHMYRMSIMAMMFETDEKLGIDKDRCIKLALIHDLAECIVGDLTPNCGVPTEEKHRMEREAMTHLCSLIHEKAGNEINSLYLEYENQSTPNAILVKELDRYDMILQAFEYEKKTEQPKSLQEFFDSTMGKFKNPIVLKWVEELYAKRGEFIANECNPKLE